MHRPSIKKNGLGNLRFVVVTPWTLSRRRDLAVCLDTLSWSAPLANEFQVGGQRVYMHECHTRRTRRVIATWH